MVVDFSKINVKERPMLILKTSDGVPLGTLGYAHNVIAEICYNEISKLTFDIPAYVEKKKVPFYNNVIGTRMVDLKNVGRFILANPKIKSDGIREVKECTAYSLEYEFTYKKITLDNATYNFWNPVATDGTILGLILEKMPSWSVGTVDSDLIGRYRTFDVNNENLYNLIKSKLQETYQCIFEFDTYERKINVRSVNSIVATKPVYFSFNNLIKDIEIAEDSENVLTCLDVSGADGIDIRSVNPMGTNKIYDFSYFMNTTNFSQDFIDKYNSWKTTFESYQLPYYNLTVEYALKTTELLTEQAALTDLFGQLKSLDNQKAVTLQAIAQGLQSQSNLNAINQQISAKNIEISSKQSVISQIEQQANNIVAQMAVINKATAFSAFFTNSELLLLDKFIKEDSLQDSSFVAPAVKNYNTADLSNTISSIPYSITGAKITKTVNSIGRDVFTVTGGTISVTSGIQLKSEIVKASYIVGSDKTFLFTAYLKAGTVDGSSFESGCVSLTGSISGLTSSDVVPDATLPAISNGTRLSFTVVSARFYFTQNTTAYEQRSIEWDLYDYGRECLSKLAYPSYTFSVSMANFLSDDDFITFKNSVMLGNKVYLKMVDEGVMQPIAVKCVIKFDKLDDFSFEFGSTYKVIDSEFRLNDLLQQSISMGSKLDSSQFNYNAWVESGAETSVSQFMKNALDVARNEIMSSIGQAITLDETGLRIRKRKDGSDTEYDPFQIWMNNGMIMFTADGWSSGNIAIGQIKTESGGIAGGVIADVLVGKMLASNNMVIESAKKDGGKAVFRVDGNGAALYNSTFDVYNGSNTQVTINPYSGIAIGKYPLYSGSDYKINTSNAKFWVDANGDVFIRGNITMTGGSISWGNIDETGSASYQYADSAYKYAGEAYKYADGISVEAQQALNALKTGLGYTYINGKYVISPNIVGGSISAQTTLNVGNGNFVVDSAGNVYMKGIIQASDFRDLSGRSMLSGAYKFTSQYLDLLGINVGNGNFVVDSAGNVSIRGNIQMGAGSSINWNYVNSDPLATNANNLANTANNLANTANNQANNAYSLANTAYNNASAADQLARRIANGTFSGGTFINGTEIYSPTIRANEFVVQPSNQYSRTGGYSIYGYFGSTLYNMFRLSYYAGDGAYINFDSPASAIAYWNFPVSRFSGNIDFSSANVSGLYATFA